MSRQPEQAPRGPQPASTDQAEGLLARRPGRSRLLRGLRFATGALAVVFAVAAFWKLLGRWDAASLSIRWGYVIAAGVPLAFGSLALARAWRVLIARMSGVQMMPRLARAVHIESQLGRYAPGKVGAPLVRIAAAPLLGISARVAGASVFIETIGVISLGIVLGAALLGSSGYMKRALGTSDHWAWLLLVGLLAGTLLLVVLDRRHYPGFVRSLLPAEGRGALLPARSLGWYAVFWAGWALHGLLLSLGVGASTSTAAAGAGLYVIAPVVGFLALAAPAGLGVREAVLSLALAQELGATAALAAALLSRMVSVVAEVGIWAVARVLARPREPRNSRSGPQK